MLLVVVYSILCIFLINVHQLNFIPLKNFKTLKQVEIFLKSLLNT